LPRKGRELAERGGFLGPLELEEEACREGGKNRIGITCKCPSVKNACTHLTSQLPAVATDAT
jgi:hypothetical protein